MVLGARVNALFQGRMHVSINDIRATAKPALRHRIGRNFEAEAEGLSTDDIIDRILNEVAEIDGRVAQELSA